MNQKNMQKKKKVEDQIKNLEIIDVENVDIDVGTHLHVQEENNDSIMYLGTFKSFKKEKDKNVRTGVIYKREGDTDNIIREHDFVNTIFLENRTLYKKNIFYKPKDNIPVEAGKRKSRRNRKSKKGKKSRKARKSRRKSNRRRR